MSRIMMRTLELVSQAKWASFCYRYAGYDDALRVEKAFKMVLARGNGIILPRYLCLVAKIDSFPVKMTVSVPRMDALWSMRTQIVNLSGLSN